MCTNQGCKAFIPNDKVGYEYVYCYFVAYNDYLQSLGKGTTFQELSTTEFRNSLFVLPSFPVQTAIIAHIQEETSQIDTAIRTIEDEIRLIEEYRTSLIHQAVTGKISI